MIPLTQYEAAAAFLRGRLEELPRTAVVLGSGLGSLAEKAEAKARIPYGDIPGFPRSTVASHAGVLTVGRLNGAPVWIMSGRFHYYEGYSFETVCFYVRVLHLLGVKQLVVTNAAGGVNESFQAGDFMMITDHIKLAAESPARGPFCPPSAAAFLICPVPIHPVCRPSPGLRRKNWIYRCGRVFISSWRDPSLKHRPKSGPSAFWAGTLWACPPLPR